MSEGAAQVEEMPGRIFETRQPFELSDEHQARVDELNLGETVEHVKEHGYGYIHDAASSEFVERLRETIMRIVRGGEGGYGLEGRGANMLLPKDPVFAEVVLNRRS